MDLETVWYEVSPYLYTVAGLLTLLFSRAPISIASGILLLAAGATILRMRWKNRNRTRKSTETHSDVGGDSDNADKP
jgi:hypothetical protein